MGCKKWESDGLLYVAGELQEEASAEFESHLADCDECLEELEQHHEMFGEFTVEDLVSAEPSEACDVKVMKALNREAVDETVAVTTMPGFFSMILQRVAVPLAIFALAVVVGVQVSHKSGISHDAMAKKDNSTIVADSADSSEDSARIFIQGGGSGVIPVTLEDE